MDKASREIPLGGSGQGVKEEEDQTVRSAKVNGVWSPEEYSVATTRYIGIIKNIEDYDPANVIDHDRLPEEPVEWVKKLWDAFMNMEGITDKQMNSGKPCQAATRLSSGYYPNLAIERVCWELVTSCGDATVGATLIAPHHKLPRDESLENFEARMEAIIYALKVSKAVCKMLLDPSFLHRLVDNPIKELRNKESNNKINANRDQQNHIGRAVIKRGYSDKEELQKLLGPETPQPEKKRTSKTPKPKKIPSTAKANQKNRVAKIPSAKRRRTSRVKKEEEEQEENDYNDEDEDEEDAMVDSFIKSNERPKRTRATTGRKSTYTDNQVGSGEDSSASDFKPEPKTPKKTKHAGDSDSNQLYSSPHPSFTTPCNGYPSANRYNSSFNDSARSSSNHMYPLQPGLQGFSGSPSDLFSSPVTDAYSSNDISSPLAGRGLSYSQSRSSPNRYSPGEDQALSLDQSYSITDGVHGHEVQELYSASGYPSVNNLSSADREAYMNRRYPSATSTSTNGAPFNEGQQLYMNERYTSANGLYDYESQEISQEQAHPVVNYLFAHENQELSPSQAQPSTVGASLAVQAPTPTNFSLSTKLLSPANKALLEAYQTGLLQEYNELPGKQSSSSNQKNGVQGDQILWEFGGDARPGSDHQLEFQYRGAICDVLGVPPEFVTDTQLDQLRTYAHAYNEQFHDFTYIPSFAPDTFAHGPLVNTPDGFVHLSVVDQYFSKLAHQRGDVDGNGDIVANPKTFNPNPANHLLQEALGIVPNRFGLHYTVRQAVQEMDAKWQEEHEMGGT